MSGHRLSGLPGNKDPAPSRHCPDTWPSPCTTRQAMSGISPASAARGMSRLDRELRIRAQLTIFRMEYIPDKYPTGIFTMSIPYKMELKMTPRISGLQLYLGFCKERRDTPVSLQTQGRGETGLPAHPLESVSSLPNVRCRGNFFLSSHCHFLCIITFYCHCVGVLNCNAKSFPGQGHHVTPSTSHSADIEHLLLFKIQM